MSFNVRKNMSKSQAVICILGIKQTSLLLQLDLHRLRVRTRLLDVKTKQFRYGEMLWQIPCNHLFMCNEETFPSNSKAFASELLEDIKEMFSRYYMCSE